MKRVLTIGGIVLSSWFILALINYKVEKTFVISKGSHVFLIGHLIDTGILYDFLNENCSKSEFENLKFCNYKDSLPMDVALFLWNGNLLEKTGGWANSEEEYKLIIKSTLTQPKFLALNIYRSFLYGLIQLTDVTIGQGLSPLNEGSAPYGQIHWRFRSELNNYLNSRQNKMGGVSLNLKTLNVCHSILMALSLFISLVLYLSPIRFKLDVRTKLFLTFVITAIVVNSFITAGLNSPYGRLQVRVIWLLPLALIILIVKNYSVLTQSIFKKEEIKKPV